MNSATIAAVMRLRSILSTSALLLVLAGAIASSGSARLTLINVGLRIDYPWPRAAGASSRTTPVSADSIERPRAIRRYQE